MLYSVTFGLHVTAKLKHLRLRLKGARYFPVHATYYIVSQLQRKIELGQIVVKPDDQQTTTNKQQTPHRRHSPDESPQFDPRLSECLAHGCRIKDKPSPKRNGVDDTDAVAPRWVIAEFLRKCIMILKSEFTFAYRRTFEYR